jgi:predicted tellurium resistance membrane protein TerC
MITTHILEFSTLSILEIILGLDNLIFIAIFVENLPVSLRRTTRFFGIGLGILLRIGLLVTASAMMKMQDPLFKVLSFTVTGHNLLLIIGGGFLVFKGLKEVYRFVNKTGFRNSKGSTKKKSKPFLVISQIVFIDLLLSFDSIITAVGLTNNLYIIIGAILVSLIFMILCTEVISDFIYQYPNIKILALNFVTLIGVILMLEGLDIKLSKNYLYFAICFSFFNEVLSIVHNKKKRPNG